jgi:hypothetical protein
VLNTQHKKWRHPITGVTSTESILTLIKKSEAMMDTLIQALLKNKVNEAFIKSWCEEVDYDGKQSGTTMRYFQSIYPSFRGKPSQNQSLNKTKN